MTRSRLPKAAARSSSWVAAATAVFGFSLFASSSSSSLLVNAAAAATTGAGPQFPPPPTPPPPPLADRPGPLTEGQTPPPPPPAQTEPLEHQTIRPFIAAAAAQQQQPPPPPPKTSLLHHDGPDGVSTNEPLLREQWNEASVPAVLKEEEQRNDAFRGVLERGASTQASSDTVEEDRVLDESSSSSDRLPPEANFVTPAKAFTRSEDDGRVRTTDADGDNVERQTAEAQHLSSTDPPVPPYETDRRISVSTASEDAASETTTTTTKHVSTLFQRPPEPQREWQLPSNVAPVDDLNRMTLPTLPATAEATAQRLRDPTSSLEPDLCRPIEAVSSNGIPAEIFHAPETTLTALLPPKPPKLATTLESKVASIHFQTEVPKRPGTATELLLQQQQQQQKQPLESTTAAQSRDLPRWSETARRMPEVYHIEPRAPPVMATTNDDRDPYLPETDGKKSNARQFEVPGHKQPPPPPPLLRAQQPPNPIIYQAPNHRAIPPSFSDDAQFRQQQQQGARSDSSASAAHSKGPTAPSSSADPRGSYPQQQWYPPQYYADELRRHQQLQYNTGHGYQPKTSHPRQQPQQQQPPLWKSLWRKIERGLDSLADMEGVVSDRAHQLISSTVAAVKVPTVKVPSVNTIPPVWGSQPVGKEPPPQPQMGMSRFHKTVVPNAVSTAGTPDDESDIEFDETEDDKLKVSVAIHPYGVMFQKASVQPSDKTARAEQKVQTSLLTSRSIDWSSIQTGQRAVSGKTSRLISANGGASTPHDASNQSPFATGHATGPTRSNGRTYQHGDSSNIIPTDPQSFSHVSHQTPMTQRPPTYPVSSQSADLTSAVVQPSGRPTPQESSNADALRAPQRISPRRPYPDDDDDVTLMEKMGRFVPRIKLPFRLNPFQRGMSRDFENAALDAWRADEEASRAEGGGFFGFFTRKQSDLDSIPRYVQSKEQKDVITAPVADLIERCGKGEASSLLNAKEEDRCRSIGRQKAVFDLLFLAFMLAGTQHLPDDGRVFRLPRSVVEALTTGVTDLLNLVAASTETWSPYAFVSAFLAVKTRSLLCDKKERALAAEAESSIREESQYGSLFLRVVSSVAVERNMPKKMEAATRAQIASKVDIARLQAFVIGILASFILMAVSVLRPLSTELIRAFGQLLNLEQLHVWPPQRRAIADGFKTAFTPLLSNAGALVGDALHGFVDSPLRHAYKTSILAALAAVSFLPILEGKRRHPCNLGESEIDGEEGETEMYLKFTEHVANLGASGANRLGLMAVDGGVDSVLERWRSMIPRKSFDSQINVAFKSVVRLACYGAVSCFLLSGPLLLYKYMDISKAGSTKSFLPRWDSLFDVSFVLFFTHYLVWESLLKTVRAGDVKVKIMGFVTALASVADERKKLLAAPPSNLQMQSVSPTAGVTVRDLWASHVTKRAWAVRGANLSCRSGEILALLGDDGAGKTRLITVLAESMVSPSRRALSAQRVRGSVAVGGLDVSKWDSRQLRRRLGISVHDVRSVIDTAHILTGLSLDEILDPSARIRNFDPSRSPGPSERAAMMLALNITGLYSSLLQRLPSKMATLVTASEEDLHPSSLRPRYQILSQAEWSKILLARVLAQAIYDNENSAGAHDAIVNSLVGSVLLLDDLTLHLSEAEEARLLQDLRKSGAATVITSNRWATGRFADRIAVIKDGAIVETGTHSELLNRGPQQSIYAAKWHAMTSISPA